MTKSPIVIIGGGLSGLSLAYALQQGGHDYLIIEARARLGGRIASLIVDDTAFDLGPSWVWTGQERVAQLLADLGLRVFAQPCDGIQLYEQPNGQVIRDAGFMAMHGALRIAGGTGALIAALAARLDPARILTGAQAQTITPQGVMLTDGRQIAAERIVLAIPPRLAAALTFTPALPAAAMQALAAVPVWMGAHAKCVAVYDSPFWRAQGLSGDASSRRGPLAEIHDASPASGPLGALFGFVGLPAASRAQVDIAGMALAQLVHLFGPAAGQPRAIRVMDWSAEPFTATTADATPPAGHPPYHLAQVLQRVWDDRIIFAVTEFAPDNGGLIEGALAASDRAARIIQQAAPH